MWRCERARPQDLLRGAQPHMWPHIDGVMDDPDSGNDRPALRMAYA